MPVSVNSYPESHILFEKGGAHVAQHGHWVQRMTDRADLYGESLPGVPVVELAGDRRVLIERHKGVTAYSDEQICVRLSYGYLSICGCNLELTRMTREQLIISGRIDGIQIQRRCRK